MRFAILSTSLINLFTPAPAVGIVAFAYINISAEKPYQKRIYILCCAINTVVAGRAQNNSATNTEPPSSRTQRAGKTYFLYLFLFSFFDGEFRKGISTEFIISCIHFDDGKNTTGDTPGKDVTEILVYIWKKVCEDKCALNSDQQVRQIRAKNLVNKCTLKTIQFS